MSCWLSSAMGLELGFVIVQASTVANTSISRGRRALGVA